MVLLTAIQANTDNKITMLRVLLVLEDYGELMFLQTVLKKIGFDVDSIQNPRLFSDSLLSMNPDVLVMTALGKRIKGVELVPTIKKSRGIPKIILIRAGTISKDTYKDLDVEAWLDSPVGAPDLLDKIAELSNLNKQTLQDKLLKLRMQDGEVDHARVLKMNHEASVDNSMHRSEKPAGNFGALKASTMSVSDRQARFKKFSEDANVAKIGFALKDVQAQVKALRLDESKTDLEEIERQRRAFVEHLFKKKLA